MGNRFDAYLAGRVAIEPTLDTTKDGKPWVRFRLAVEDRSPNSEAGEWETSQTIFHDVVAFGRLADRTLATVHSGDAVIVQGEFRFRSYDDSTGMTRTGTQFVATRLGPDILLSDVTVHRGRGRDGEADRSHDAIREALSAAGEWGNASRVPGGSIQWIVAGGTHTSESRRTSGSDPAQGRSGVCGVGSAHAAAALSHPMRHLLSIFRLTGPGEAAVNQHVPSDPDDSADAPHDDVLFEEMVSALGGDMPHPVDWSELSPVQRRDELQRLWPWVVDVARTWPVSRDVLPPCWYRHESLIRVLSAARDAYLTAFEPSQAASAAADWMHVWDATEERLRRWVARSGCRSEHHPDRLQRWVADEDVATVAAEEFERFVVDDFERHSATEVP